MRLILASRLSVLLTYWQQHVGRAPSVSVSVTMLIFTLGSSTSHHLRSFLRSVSASCQASRSCATGSVLTPRTPPQPT